MIVIKIGDRIFSDKTPLGIVPHYTGVVKNLRLPALTVNLRRASTPTYSISFDLVGIVDELIGREDYFLFQRVEAFIFEDNEDFSQARRLPSVFISGISHDELSFKFSCTSTEQLLTRALRLPKSTLTQSFVEASTLIATEQDFPPSGFVKIGDEFIEYETRDGQELRSLRRAILGSSRSSAEIGEAVDFVLRVRGNPVTIMLQLLLSQGEGGEYDSLLAGLGLPESNIDIESFELVRDSFFQNWEFEFYLTSLPKLSDFLQQEILQATGCRFVDRQGKIALVALGQNEYDPLEVSTLVDGTMAKYKGTEAKFFDIVNDIRFEFDYLPGRNRYREVVEREDKKSIEKFGRSEQVTYRFKGVRDIAVIEDLAKRYLARFAVPSPEIKIETVQSEVEIGRTIVLRSDFIPGPWGKDTARPLEILKKSIDILSSKANLTLAFTSFTTGRTSLISASPSISSHNGKILQVESSKGFDIGFKVRIHDRTTQEFIPGVFTIVKITQNTIELDNDPRLGEGVYFLSFADYDDCVETQKLWSFIGSNDEAFSDGQLYYEIV